MRLSRTRSLLALLAAAVPLAGCDSILGNGRDEYRDVSWELVGVDGVQGTFEVPMGTYSYAVPEGTMQCAVGASVQRIVPWGWVEAAGSGRIVALIPERDGPPPYEMLDIHAHGACDGPDGETFWLVMAPLMANYGVENNELVIRSAAMGEGQLTLGPGTADEIAARLEPSLSDAVPIRPVMTLNLHLTVRHWSDEGDAVLGELSKNLALMYERREEVNTRASP